jgi:hypothetical protein
MEHTGNRNDGIQWNGSILQSVTACKVHSGNPIFVSQVYLTNTVFPRNEVEAFPMFFVLIICVLY